jgi:hypothetical protein
LQGTSVCAYPRYNAAEHILHINNGYRRPI